MTKMLAAAKQRIEQQDGWIKERRSRIESSLAKLNEDFAKLLKGSN
jgi:argininosuccinate lyase